MSTPKRSSRPRRWLRFWLRMYSATSVRVRTRRLCVLLLMSISSTARSTCSATDGAARTMPAPAQCGQGIGRALQHAGADALARHFHQAEGRDAADLDARAVVLERVLEAALDRAVVPVLLHVDEVDHDEAGEVAQAKLAGHLVGGLAVRLGRGVLDVVLARGAAGVHVDRDESLGLVDDDVAAGLERHLAGEHRIELRFDAEAGEERLDLAVGLHVLGMARHEHAHEVLDSLYAASPATSTSSMSLL